MSIAKIRAVAIPGSEIAAQRYHLYRAAHARIKEAMEAGFYLEAIAIIESIATDRLESRLSFLLQANHGFKTLGLLIAKIRTNETDASLRSIVDGDLNAWRELRNEALHEMAKLAVGDTSTWEDRMQVLVIVAIDGLTVLRAIDQRCKSLRREGR